MARYTAEERVQYFWAPAIANTAAPKIAEMTAATKLCDIVVFPNFALEPSLVDDPDLCSRVVSQIPGVSKYSSTSITFRADDSTSSASETIRALLDEGVTGFIVRVQPIAGAAQPLATGMICAEVVPVTIQSNSWVATAFNELEKWMVGLAITGAKKTDVAVVA